MDTNAPPKPFRFLTLPAELRLHVYDSLFTPLVLRHEQLDPSTYRHHSAWPRKNDFTDYTNLLLTCKEINAEVNKPWRLYYAEQCTFYFWEMASLHRVATSLLALGAPYDQATIVLRIRPHDEYSVPSAEDIYAFHPIDDLVSDFIGEQEGFKDDWFIHMLLTDEPENFTPGTYDMGEGIVKRVHKREGGGIVGTVTYPRLPTCQVWTHWADDQDEFGVLRSTFATAMLGGYDPLQGWERLIWWREFEKMGFPTGEEERRELYRLVQQRKVSDEMWQRLEGGRKEVLQDEVEVAERWIVGCIDWSG